MSSEVRTTDPTEPGQRDGQSVSRAGYGAGEVGKALMLVNAVLVGVPGAYLASKSLAVTALTVATACLTLVVYMRYGRTVVR